MSATAFFDSLGDARARWLDGDADAWTLYIERCLRLEAELRSVQPKCSSRCTSCRCSAQKPADSRPPRATAP